MKRPRKRTLQTCLGCALIALIVFAGFARMLANGNLEYLELKAHDLWVNLQPGDGRMSDKIVVVVIKEDEVQQMDQEYPLRDEKFLELLRKIQQQKPLAIGVDLFRNRELGPVLSKDAQNTVDRLREDDAKRDAGAAIQDIRTLGKQIPPSEASDFAGFVTDDNNANVFFVLRLAPKDHQDRMVPPPEVFQTYRFDNRPDFLRSRIGVAVVTQDRDGIIRRGILGQGNELGIEQLAKNLPPEQRDPPSYMSLSGLLAREYALHNPVKGAAGSELVIGDNAAEFGRTTFRKFNGNDGPYVDQRIGGFEFMLDFRGGDKNHLFEQLSMSEAMHAPAETFAGKLVFLGTEAVSVNDHVPTPVRAQHSGVQLQAQMCDQLLRGCYFGTAPVRTLGTFGNAAWLGFWTVFSVVFGVIVRGPGRFAIGVICGLVITTVGAYSCYVHGWWIPFAAPSMAWFTGAAITTSYMAYRERANRELLKKLFGPYIERTVLEKLLEDPERIIVDGRLRQEKLTATVLFTDMVGYSTVSEQFNDPQALMSWLDEYMSAMSELVISQGGMVDKYIGDAVMAVFGAPISHGIADDARRAVKCALLMRDKLKTLNASWATRNIPEVGMRVGIATGELVAGSLGGADRLEYTVIGDIVNTASRLESVGKTNPGVPPSVLAGRCRILIAGPPVSSPRTGNSTYELISNEFEMIRVPKIEEEGLKGMQKHLEIFGVVGTKSTATIGDVQPSSPVVPAPLKIPQPVSEVTT